MDTYASSITIGTRETSSRKDAVAQLINLGVPPTSLRRGSGTELRRLRAELDRFTAFGYGSATQRAFLHAPHPQLRMSTPAEALADRDGIEAVRRAVRHTLAAVR